MHRQGFPGGSAVKNPPANAKATGDMGSIPGLGISPGGGNGNPLRYSCRDNPMDRGGLYSPWGWKSVWHYWAHTHPCSVSLDMSKELPKCSYQFTHSPIIHEGSDCAIHILTNPWYSLLISFQSLSWVCELLITASLSCISLSKWSWVLFKYLYWSSGYPLFWNTYSSHLSIFLLGYLLFSRWFVMESYW